MKKLGYIGNTFMVLEKVSDISKIRKGWCQKTDETFMLKNPTKGGKGNFIFSLDKGRHKS